MNKQPVYKPHKPLILSGSSNKLNNIVQKDLNKKDYNMIKEMVMEKENNILTHSKSDVKQKKILPPPTKKK